MKNLTRDTYDKFISLENLHQETLTENLRDQLKKLKKEIFEDVKDIPLVDGFNIEILRWEKSHKIECIGHDPKETKKIEKMGETLYLCYSPDTLAKRDVKYYFITDGKWSIKLKEHQTEKNWVLKIFKETMEDRYEIEDTFHNSEEVRKRFLKLTGSNYFNFSWVFRNSEHVCRYIQYS